MDEHRYTKEPGFYLEHKIDSINENGLALQKKIDELIKLITENKNEKNN